MRFYTITTNKEYLYLQNQLFPLWADELVVINLANQEVEQYCLEMGLEFYNLPQIDLGDAINWVIQNLVSGSENWGIIGENVFITQNIEFSRYETEVISRMKISDETPYMAPELLLCETGVDFSDVDFSIEPYGIDTNKKINEYTVDWVKAELFEELPTITTYTLNQNIIGFKYDGTDISEVQWFLTKLGF
jgi:hypothetical protein